jgi:Fe2+ or Zn2+ uptake regulation protein
MIRTPKNPFAGIEGQRVGEEPGDEREHFIICEACGQAVDLRDLGQVYHHEEPGHSPIALDA